MSYLFFLSLPALICDFLWIFLAFKIGRQESKNRMSLLLAIFFVVIAFGTCCGTVTAPLGYFERVASLGNIILLNSLFGIFIFLLVFNCFLNEPAPWLKTNQATYYVVLGAYLAQGKQIGPLLGGRITTAMLAAKKTPTSPVVIFSGGQGIDEQLSEGLAMRDFAQEHFAYSAKNLWIEDASHSTQENLLNTLRVIHQHQPDWIGQLVIFTSDYHCLRTWLLARQLNINFVISTSKSSTRNFWQGVGREFIALLNQYRFCLILSLPLIYGVLLLLVAWR